MGGGSSEPTQPEAPKPKASYVNFNGQSVATQVPDSSGNTTTDLNSTPYNQSIINYDTAHINDAMANVNTLSPDVQKSLESSANANYDQGLQQYNKNYNDTYQQNQQSVANRFGGLNTTALSDANQTNQYNYGQGLSSLSNQYIGNMQTYKAQALQQNYDYLNSLNNSYNNAYQQSLGYSNASQGSTNSSNNFASNIYNTQGQMYSAQEQAYQAQQAANQNAMMGLLGGIGSSAMSMF